jgi:ferredoxin-like protein FixX
MEDGRGGEVQVKSVRQSKQVHYQDYQLNPEDTPQTCPFSSFVAHGNLGHVGESGLECGACNIVCTILGPSGLRPEWVNHRLLGCNNRG